MPAPSTIVTFYDADGDEFPVRVPGAYEAAQRTELLVEARWLFDEFADTGVFKPTYPLRPDTTIMEA